MFCHKEIEIHDDGKLKNDQKEKLHLLDLYAGFRRRILNMLRNF